jgi:hypothetical protein
MDARVILDKVPYVAFYALFIGHVLMLGTWIIAGLRQTGGFPSSFEELQTMSARIDKASFAARAKRYKRYMLFLWIASFALLIAGAIARTALN